MRLSVALGLWLIGLSALIVGVHGLAQLREEESDLYTAATRELTLVATAVRSTARNALRDHQEGDIDALLQQLELKDPAIDIFVFRDKTDLLGSSWGSAENLPRARSLTTAPAEGTSVRVEQLADGAIAVIAPFSAVGRTRGHVVIIRSPVALLSDLEDERDAVLLSILALVGALAIGVWVVLHVRLQRPIARMVAIVHRVADGDLSARMARPGNDELAELAREFDAMVSSLERAREQAAREAESREQIEAEMLRANRLAIVGELAATLAHEIGSPLQVLGGRAHDVAQREDLPEKVQRSSTIMVEQVERIRQILERFLDVARRKQPVLRSVEFDAAVRDVLELLGPLCKRRTLQVLADLQTDCEVQADPAQVQQVLLNLLQNAMRASTAGSTVRVGVAPSSFQTRPDGPQLPSVRLTVEDQGCGIPKGAREQVFQPFFTAWSIDPAQAPGTGLGLSVVRTIVTDHGGSVFVEPGSEGRGTRFVAHFPRGAPASVAREGQVP